MDHYTEIEPAYLKYLSTLDRQWYYDGIVKYDGVWGYLEAMHVALTGHFVFTGGGHGNAYVNIRDLNDPKLLAPIAMQMAWEMRKYKLDALVGTPHGADTLTVLVAYYYTQFTGHPVQVLKPLKGSEGLRWYKDHGERVVGKRIFQIEDVINSAKSLRETMQFICASHGTLLGFISVCNRISDKNPGLAFLEKELGIIHASALTEIEVVNHAVDLSIDPRDQCPLCAENVLINTRVGHGVKFLEDIKVLYPDFHDQLSIAKV